MGESRQHGEDRTRSRPGHLRVGPGDPLRERSPLMKSVLSGILWAAIAALAAGAFAVMALKRGEPVNAAWLVTAALCSYAVGYRFYARFIATRVFALDDARPTPAVRR